MPKTTRLLWLVCHAEIHLRTHARFWEVRDIKRMFPWAFE